MPPDQGITRPIYNLDRLVMDKPPKYLGDMRQQLEEWRFGADLPFALNHLIRAMLLQPYGAVPLMTM
jgi:hypothetical protein